MNLKNRALKEWSTENVKSSQAWDHLSPKGSKIVQHIEEAQSVQIPSLSYLTWDI